jgi:hypothetical protein
MPKVLIRTVEQTTTTALPAGYAGTATSRRYFADQSAVLQLDAFEYRHSDTLQFGRCDIDRVAYVWSGAISALDHTLRAGSSFIVEHGCELQTHGEAENCAVLVFSAPTPNRQHRAGGHIHLLPTARVPRSVDLGGASGVAGGMHADAACPTCEVWLHENSFPGTSESQRMDAEAGIHSHTEDEIIVVTGGQICLGSRLYGPGTALAIAANTLYSFTAGPDGLSFVNFRASAPGLISFRNRPAVDERGYWSSRLPRPVYVNL